MATNLEDAAKREMTEEIVRNFGEVRLRVTGTSMMPSVWPGDVITVRRRSPNELLVGQIVLYRRNRRFVAHRLIGRRNDGLVTRGDTLSYDDPPFHMSELLGEVVSILRDGRIVPLCPAWWHSAGRLIVGHSGTCTRILLRLRRSSAWSWAQ